MFCLSLDPLHRSHCICMYFCSPYAWHVIDFANIVCLFAGWLNAKWPLYRKKRKIWDKRNGRMGCCVVDICVRAADSGNSKHKFILQAKWLLPHTESHLLRRAKAKRKKNNQIAGQGMELREKMMEKSFGFHCIWVYYYYHLRLALILAYGCRMQVTLSKL